MVAANNRIYSAVKVRMENFTHPPFAPKHPVVVDEYGHSVLPVNAYLNQKLYDHAPRATINAYAYILADIVGVFHASGLGLDDLDNSWLSALRDHMIHPQEHRGEPTGNREVLDETFQDYLSCLLRFLLYAETNGWTSGLIGVGTHFRIPITFSGNKILHPLRKSKSRRAPVILPSENVFTLVESEVNRSRNSSILKERDRVRILMQKKGALRRSEVLAIKCSQIPTQASISARLARRDFSPVMIQMISAKTGHVKAVPFSVADVQEIRRFIDKMRPKTRPASGVEEIFISQKTRRALIPQSTTNQFRDAAIAASVTARSLDIYEFGEVDIARTRQHFYRHKRATESLKFYLKCGKPPLEALIVVMADLGISSLETASVYLHMAYKEMRSGEDDERSIAGNIRETVSETIELVRLHVSKRKRT